MVYNEVSQGAHDYLGCHRPVAVLLSLGDDPMLNIRDLRIDPASLGRKMLLVDVMPAYEYKDGKRTETVTGYESQGKLQFSAKASGIFPVD